MRMSIVELTQVVRRVRVADPELALELVEPLREILWGAGHDPFTWQVSEHASACMSSMAKAVGFYGEDVSEPAEIIPALKRAFDENAKGRPAFVEFICSHHPVHGGWVR